MFIYINENLEKIKNPDDVYIIKPAKADKGGWALWARINNGEEVQLTKPLGKLNFPFEPIYWLASEQFGRFYFENFGTIDNLLSINKKHLTKLGYVDTNEKRLTTYAYFDDDRIIELYHPYKKYFFKSLKPKMEQTFGLQFENITEELKQQKGLN